jgi:hypothetical protein
MSFFISAMPEPGFRLSPPVSKQTPLPTIARRGWPCLAPFQPHDARAASGRARAADGVHGGETLRERFAVDHLHLRTVARAECQNRVGEFRGSERVGWQVDEVAHGRGGLGFGDGVGGVRAADQDARAFVVRLASGAAMLRHQPAVQRFRGHFGAVHACRQASRRRREAPAAGRRGVGDSDGPAAFAEPDQRIGLAAEPGRRHSRALVGVERRGPRIEAARIDEMQPRGVVARRANQSCEVGHANSSVSAAVTRTAPQGAGRGR